MRSKGGSFCARNRSVEAVCLPGLGKQQARAEGAEAPEASAQRVPAEGGSASRAAEDGAKMAAFSGASAEQGGRSERPDRRLGLSRGAERGRTAEEGAVRAVSSMPAPGAGSGGPVVAREAQSVRFAVAGRQPFAVRWRPAGPLRCSLPSVSPSSRPSPGCPARCGGGAAAALGAPGLLRWDVAGGAGNRLLAAPGEGPGRAGPGGSGARREGSREVTALHLEFSPGPSRTKSPRHRPDPSSWLSAVTSTVTSHILKL